MLLALTVGGDAVLWTLLLLFGLQQLEGYLLTPLIRRRAVSPLPP
jgi:predicted PurR-regulated permease PerM